MGRKKSEKWYALYRGDTFITHGTLEDIGKFIGYQRKSLLVLLYPSYRKNLTEDRLMLIEVEE